MTQSNILSNIGRGALGVLSLGTSELARNQREEEQAQQAELANILAGQTIPQFARAGGAEPSSAEEIKQAQMAQLANLAGQGNKEALNIIAKQSPLMQEAAAPLSTIGKIQADINAGRISPELGQAKLDKETAPSQPVVNVNTGGEGAGQKEIAKARAARITNIRDIGDKANIVAFGANRLQQAIDRGNVGALSDIKALGVELAEGFGIPIKSDLLTKAKDVRAVERILARGALDTLESLKGSTSNKDLSFAQRISGLVTQGKASLQELADMMIAQSMKAQQISDAVINADLEGSSLKEQDALIAKLKKDISIEDIYENIKAEREASKPQDVLPTPASPVSGFKILSFE